MNNRITFSDYIITALLATIAYCIPLAYFFKNELVTNSWVLYIANLVFTIIVVTATTIINLRIHDETSIVKMISIGVKITIASIVIAIPFVVILFYMLGNNVITSITTANSLSITLPMLLINLVIVNIFLGSFAALIAALIFNKYPKNSKGQDIT
ncbi:MAG: hypothetical protein H7068_11910 [Pedobacter sp.]|nr:hypothetical protein [Chitinophagaceae bacterium]